MHSSLSKAGVFSLNNAATATFLMLPGWVTTRVRNHHYSPLIPDIIVVALTDSIFGFNDLTLGISCFRGINTLLARRFGLFFRPFFPFRIPPVFGPFFFEGNRVAEEAIMQLRTRFVFFLLFLHLCSCIESKSRESSVPPSPSPHSHRASARRRRIRSRPSIAWFWRLT